MPVQSLLKPEVKVLLNKSIASELYASNLYKHLAAQMQRAGYFGTQKFFEKESADELNHYYILRDYLNDMGDMADMPQVDAIMDVALGIGSALQIAYDTERTLLFQYQEIYESVEDDMSDCITAQFLLQFLEIQRKAVGEFGDLISRFEKNPSDVFLFDTFMGKLAK
jgi:ferritin